MEGLQGDRHEDGRRALRELPEGRKDQGGRGGASHHPDHAGEHHEPGDHAEPCKPAGTLYRLPCSHTRKGTAEKMER